MSIAKESKMKKWIQLFVFIFLCHEIVCAQAKLYRVNPSDTIDCKIKEIGEELIRYTTPESGEDLEFSIDKNNVLKIVFSDGREMTFSHTMFEKEHDETQRKNAIKLSFLSIVYNSPTFSYERSIKPGQSMVFGLGVIGAGYDAPDKKAKGVILKAGYKFMTSPSYYKRKLRYAHVLKGGYVKPEITFITYTSLRYRVDDIDNHEFDYEERERTTLCTVMITGGKQWVFNDIFLIDLFGGLGYGFGHKPDNKDRWHYNFIGVVDHMPLAFTAGINIGILFGRGNPRH